MVNVDQKITQEPSPLLSWKPRGLIEAKTRIYVTNENILLHVVFLSIRVY